MARPQRRPRHTAGDGLMLLSVYLSMLELSTRMLRLKLDIQKKRKRERKTKEYSTRRQGITIDSVSECMDKHDFSLAFRMKRAIFDKLLDLAEPAIRNNVTMGDRAKRPTVFPPIRLALSLRMLAGASVHDMVSTFHVDQRTAYDIFRDIRKALNNLLTFPGLPKTFHELKKAAEDFQASRGCPNPLPGCIGALDGISIKIRKPAENSTAYWCRKGYFTTPVQAVCDANYPFLCFSAVCKGPAHDSLAYSFSALGKFLVEAGLQEQFWLAADEAYVCTTCLITPVPGAQAVDVEDAFNFFHSSIRMHIEQAFGMLRSKWRILDYLDYEVEEAAEIVGLTMKLHNFCVENNGTVPLSAPRSAEHIKAIQGSEEWFTEGKHDYLEQIGRPGMQKRNHLIEMIRKGNFVRPAVRPVRIPDHLRITLPTNANES